MSRIGGSSIGQPDGRTVEHTQDGGKGAFCRHNGKINRHERNSRHLVVVVVMVLDSADVPLDFWKLLIYLKAFLLQAIKE